MADAADEQPVPEISSDEGCDTEEIEKFKDFLKAKRKRKANKPEENPHQAPQSTTGKKKTPKRSPPKHKWTHEEILHVIESLESRPCLWDVFHKSYHLKDEREKALSEIADGTGIDVNEIKSKINGLRAQLGREMAKVAQTKSGQGRDEVYKSSWTYWEQLQFLCPVMQPGKSRDSLALPVESPTGPEKKENEDPLQRQTTTAKTTKKSLDLKKHELLSKCIDVLKEPSQQQPSKESPQCPFSLFVAEKMKTFDRKKRMTAEKMITDILFNLEIYGQDFNQPPSSNSSLNQGYSIYTL